MNEYVTNILNTEGCYIGYSTLNKEIDYYLKIYNDNRFIDYFEYITTVGMKDSYG